MSFDLSKLRASVHAWRTRAICGKTLVCQWRAELAETHLPGRFRPVLEQLLSSVELTAEFELEACGLSRSDVCDNLSSWLDAYERRVRVPEAA